jgi:gluconate 2-dehydrogenase gamma chain
MGGFFMTDETKLSRRHFLKYTGAVTGAAATLSLSSTVMAADHAMQGHGSASANPLSRGRMFFTNDLEFSVLSEAAERIFPKDDLGPGAKDLAVPFFIDNQLAGAYGYNAREYTYGPYYPDTPTQGYQTPLLRRDVFKQALAALNNSARERFKKDFPQLEGPQQDQVLSDCQAGKIPMPGFTSSYFFSLLLNLVLAGVYADPIYNGNNNMDGWRMKSYPGAQMSYSYLITNEQFDNVDPMSLSSMQ